MSANSERRITLTGDLHARPAGALALAVAKLDATVWITVGDRTADAKSVLGVMGLGATAGQTVTVSATGPGAHEATDVIAGILAGATHVGT